MSQNRTYRGTDELARDPFYAGGQPDPFYGGEPPSMGGYQPYPTTPVGGQGQGPEPLDFASILLGQNQGGQGPAFEDTAPEPIDPFDMKRYHVEPKSVPKLPLWGLIATGLLDAVNMRQQIKPGRTKMQYQSPSGKTKTVYQARQAPASSNALATLLTGHAAQKRQATGEADQFNRALDMMGIKGRTEDLVTQQAQARKRSQNPLAGFTSSSPDVSEAAALYELMGPEAAKERLLRPKPAKGASATAIGSADYRTARDLVRNRGIDPDENPDMVLEQMQEIVNQRKTEQTESNANRAAALNNELDVLERRINASRNRSDTLRSKLAGQSTATPTQRAVMDQAIKDAEKNAELYQNEWDTKNKELAGLPTKSKTTGTPRNESPTTNPLADGGGVVSGGSSSAPAPSPELAAPTAIPPSQASPRQNDFITENDLTPDIIRRIQANPDWKERARQMFPNRPEFQ